MLNYIDQASKQGGCGPLLEHSGPSASPLPLRQQIFQHVRSNGRAARADITRALHISAGSATTLSAELIASGILREVSEPVRDAGRGRPPVALEVVPEAAYVIGIKLSFKRHSAVLCDFAGNIITTASVPASDKRRSTSELLDEITGLVSRVCEKSGAPDRRINAIGIGLPGIVDKDSGLIRWSSLLHDPNVDLKTAFGARLDMPLFIDNDTNMLTLAELWFGVGRQKADFAVVTIENGVGMGLVVNNMLYRGTHGMGLELGHTKVQLDGALCRCGQRGCLEAYLGDYALTREAATALDRDDADLKDKDVLLELLFEKAKAGHAAAETIFRRAGRYLSIGLSNVVQLFDPPLIILSGKRTRYDYLYADEVLAEMQKLTLTQGRQPCQVEVHFWDDLDWARGATVPALSALTDTMVGGLEVQNL
ncbi:ROK family protein [Octadecabacter sp. G9-8]|uniref:ROK family protein n=1 Tax=Octadecabacter dasysiphoniae TaxID=2909341 RepID=A0ABS9CQL4_9RHOB|nr:ROK family protein [Octadecabacter dasysiphoniae]MCF2869517.1 ROK family protein [Octadecabacter dasysiphoniae]